MPEIKVASKAREKTPEAPAAARAKVAPTSAEVPAPAAAWLSAYGTAPLALAASPPDHALTARPTDDPLEREADRVARRIIPDEPLTGLPAPPHGEQASVSSLSFFEQRFNRDFGGVRIHTDGRAAESASALKAQAYTVGRDVVFAEGEFQPQTREGQRLLAHELTHVVQQGAARARSADRATPPAISQTVSHSSPPLVQRQAREPTTMTPPGAMDTRLESILADEIDGWVAAAEQSLPDDPAGAAYARRVVLLLGFPSPEDTGSEQAVYALIAASQERAQTEPDTLARLGGLGWANIAPEAFPILWGVRVRYALSLDLDVDGLTEDAEKKREATESVARGIAWYISRDGPDFFGHGLPVEFKEALELTRFVLTRGHGKLKYPHVARDYVQAVMPYLGAEWLRGFAVLWNAMADRMATAVTKGERVVKISDYETFLQLKSGGGLNVALRAQNIWDDATFRGLDEYVLDLQKITFLQGVVSTLASLARVIGLWEERRARFDEKRADADEMIGREHEMERVVQAMFWAYERSYYSESALAVARAILDQAPKIIAEIVVFIVLQHIPVVNIAVDIYLLVTMGVDLVKAVYDLGKAFERVAKADTTVSLQRESAQFAASVTGDTLRIVVDLFGIRASVKGLQTKIAKIKAENPRIGDKEALERALKEAPQKEAAHVRAIQQVEEFIQRHGDSSVARRALSIARGSVAEAEAILKFLEGKALAQGELALLQRVAPEFYESWRALRSASERGLETGRLHAVLTDAALNTADRLRIARGIDRMLRYTDVAGPELRGALDHFKPNDLARVIRALDDVKADPGEMRAALADAVTTGKTADDIITAIRERRFARETEKPPEEIVEDPLEAPKPKAGATVPVGPNPGPGPTQNPNPGWGRGQVPCFPAGTLVAGPGGARPIERVARGDAVYAYDFSSHSVVVRTVAGVYHGRTNCWVNIQLGIEQLRATRRHPVWVESDQQWVAAADVAPGMELRCLDGRMLKVDDISIAPQDHSHETYNLTIEETTCFFAGTLGVLVHNTDINQLGHRNYVLIDKSEKIYYSGRFGPNESVATVRYRHTRNNNRLILANGDRMRVLPGSRTLGEARRLEHELCVQHKTHIGRSPETWRGNRDYPMDAAKFRKYYRLDAC